MGPSFGQIKTMPQIMATTMHLHLRSRLYIDVYDAPIPKGSPVLDSCGLECLGLSSTILSITLYFRCVCRTAKCAYFTVIFDHFQRAFFRTEFGSIVLLLYSITLTYTATDQETPINSDSVYRL